MTSKKITQLTHLLLICLSLQGCFGIFDTDTHQGNIITETQIAQLTEGMTIDAVKNLLGTPVLSQNKGNVLDKERETNVNDDTDSSDDERSDLMKIEYIDLYRSRKGEKKQKHIQLLFEDGKLQQFSVVNR